MSDLLLKQLFNTDPGAAELLPHRDGQRLGVSTGQTQRKLTHLQHTHTHTHTHTHGHTRTHMRTHTHTHTHTRSGISRTQTSKPHRASNVLLLASASGINLQSAAPRLLQTDKTPARLASHVECEKSSVRKVVSESFPY